MRYLPTKAMSIRLIWKPGVLSCSCFMTKLKWTEWHIIQSEFQYTVGYCNLQLLPTDIVLFKKSCNINCKMQCSESPPVMCHHIFKKNIFSCDVIFHLISSWVADTGPYSSVSLIFNNPSELAFQLDLYFSRRNSFGDSLTVESFPTFRFPWFIPSLATQSSVTPSSGPRR